MKRHSIASVLADLNRPEKDEHAQAWHYRVLAYGDTDKQPGADLNAMWYLRNAKIFAKMMTVAKPGDRLLVVYGSGHNYWLRHFAKTTPGRVSATAARNASSPAASIAAVEERSTLTRAARRAAASAVSRSGGRTRL